MKYSVARIASQRYNETTHESYDDAVEFIKGSVKDHLNFELTEEENDALISRGFFGYSSDSPEKVFWASDCYSWEIFQKTEKA